MIKNIMINEQVYQLPLTNGMSGNNSGTCYRLKNKDMDLAVKLYFKNALHPPVWELKQFCVVMEDCLPFLLSKYPVFDEEKNYIGCATSYIEETKGDTLQFLYTTPTQDVLEYLRNLERACNVLTEESIELRDLSISNFKLGEGKNLPFGMYVFDDSFYQISLIDPKKLAEKNKQALSKMIEGMVCYYFNTHPLKRFDENPLEKQYKDQFFYCKDSISLLEQETRGYQNLEECFNDVQKKKVS